MRKCHLCPLCIPGKIKANHPMPQQTLPSRSGHPEQAVPICPHLSDETVCNNPLITPPSSLCFDLSSFQNNSENLYPIKNDKSLNKVACILHPRQPLHIAAFNVRTLSQIGQQAALAETLFSLNIDVCGVSETRIQDSGTIIYLKPPSQPSSSEPFSLRLSGDSEASARGQAGVGIALSRKAENALLDWFPVNSRLSAVRLNGSVKVSRNKNSRRCLFVVSIYAPTDCSSDDLKDKFYSDLSGLLENARSSDIVMVIGDFNAQIGRLDESERRFGGSHAIPSRRTDNGDRLLNLCAQRGLFLANTNFEHKQRHCVTWRPSMPSQPWTQIDHLAISYRWRGSVEDCRSIWSTSVDSDHALVRARVTLRLCGGK